jgi:hypothetical protein
MSELTPNNTSQFIIYQTEGGQTKIEVRLENETVWLTQKLIAELFQVAKSSISEHIKHIYEEGELIREATVRNFRTVQTESERKIAREFPLVPKHQLGNKVGEAPASRDGKLELPVPHFQAGALFVIHKRHETRHSGMDCRNPGYTDVFKLAIHGTGYPLPGGYDELPAYLCITMRAGAWGQVNIYEEDELDEQATCNNFLQVQSVDAKDST